MAVAASLQDCKRVSEKHSECMCVSAVAAATVALASPVASCFSLLLLLLLRKCAHSLLAPIVAALSLPSPDLAQTACPATRCASHSICMLARQSQEPVTGPCPNDERTRSESLL